MYDQASFTYGLGVLIIKLYEVWCILTANELSVKKGPKAKN